MERVGASYFGSALQQPASDVVSESLSIPRTLPRSHPRFCRPFTSALATGRRPCCETPHTDTPPALHVSEDMPAVLVLVFTRVLDG